MDSQMTLTLGRLSGLPRSLVHCQPPGRHQCTPHLLVPQRHQHDWHLSLMHSCCFCYGTLQPEGRWPVPALQHNQKKAGGPMHQHNGNKLMPSGHEHAGYLYGPID